MKIQVYLFFPGNASEAMEYYKSAFGGELEVTTKGQVDPSTPDNEKSLVINASLAGEDFIFRASDRSDSNTAAQNRVSITVVDNDEPKMRKLYDDLSAGGSADMPLEKQFWGDIFGSLTDKFGLNWQINIEAKKV